MGASFFALAVSDLPRRRHEQYNRLQHVLHGPVCRPLRMSAGLLKLTRNIAFFRSGDTCSVMETQYGITFDQIRQWNPEVDANCTSPSHIPLDQCLMNI